MEYPVLVAEWHSGTSPCHGRLGRQTQRLAAIFCFLALAACAVPSAGPPAGEPLYEIVAQDVAYSGGSDTPQLLAVSGERAAESTLDGLPPDVMAALQSAVVDDPTGLYIVIYSGMKPGSGYSVTVDSMSLEGVGQDQTLVVSYSETGPELGGTTALTYPYVIAHVVRPAIPPDRVTFSGPS